MKITDIRWQDAPKGIDGKAYNETGLEGMKTVIIHGKIDGVSHSCTMNASDELLADESSFLILAEMTLKKKYAYRIK